MPSYAPNAVLNAYVASLQASKPDKEPMRKPKILPMIGGDPEFFIADKSGILPSCGLLGGTKGEPIRLGEYGSYLEDNISVELNIPPSTESIGFGQNTLILLEQVRILVSEKFKAIPVIKASVEIPKVRLTHPNAFIFGCEPDYCAYDFDPSSPVDVYTARSFSPENVLGNVRCAGGHLHLSYGGDVPAHAMIILMDVIAGLPMSQYDKQGKRRDNYGKAGLFRRKAYGEGIKGVEWRTPSNWWLQKDASSQFRARHTFDAILGLGYAAEMYPEELATLFSKIPCDDVQNAIKTEDAAQAEKIYKELKNRSPPILQSYLFSNSGYAFLADDSFKQHAELHVLKMFTKGRSIKTSNIIPTAMSPHYTWNGESPHTPPPQEFISVTQDFSPSPPDDEPSE